MDGLLQDWGGMENRLAAMTPVAGELSQAFWAEVILSGPGVLAWPTLIALPPSGCPRRARRHHNTQESDEHTATAGYGPFRAADAARPDGASLHPAVLPFRNPGSTLVVIRAVAFPSRETTIASNGYKYAERSVMLTPEKA
jgi:hypothetical protein